VGDQVKSRDPATGKDEVKIVTNTIERHAPSVVTVAFHDAKTDQSETLTCTPEHPFSVQGQGWVEAGSLGIGTSIVTRAGPQMAVASVTWQKNKAQELAAGGGLGGYTVYNLTVDGDHTFFVGTTGGGTWVHNACISGSEAPTTPAEMDSLVGRSGVRSGNPSNKTTWESDDGLTRYRYEEHPTEPGETYNPRHHGPHFHVEDRPSTGTGWNNGAVTKQYPPGYTPGGGTGFLPGEFFP